MQCLNGQCGVPVAIVQPAPNYSRPTASVGAAGYAWTPSADRQTWFLFKDGKQVGTYRRSDDVYTSIDILGQWHSDATPPIAIPTEAWPASPSKHSSQFFGVDVDKIKGSPAYELNGVAVSRDQLVAAMRGGLLPETAGKYWLSIAGGTPEQRKRVADDVAASPTLAGKLQVQTYEAAAWPLAVGLQANGSPTIQLLGPEGPDGKAVELARWDAHPGVEAIEGALRQRDPSYDPERVRRPDLMPAFDSPIVIGGLVLLAAFVFLPRRRR